MEMPCPLKYFWSTLPVLVWAAIKIKWYTSITRLTLEQGRKRVSTYMFFEGDIALMTPFNFFKVPLEPHTLLLYNSPFVFKGIGIPFSTINCLVVIVMIGNPTPISFAWLVIPLQEIRIRFSVITDERSSITEEYRLYSSVNRWSNREI
jgi:hypothetical protein